MKNNRDKNTSILIAGLMLSLVFIFSAIWLVKMVEFRARQELYSYGVDGDDVEAGAKAIKTTTIVCASVMLIFVLMVLYIVFAVYKGMRKQAGLLEKARLEAEEGSRAKSDFLTNMSHDIRTPMNAIVGYTHLARQKGVTEERMQDYLAKIESSSEHLLSIVNDILDMSQIETGKFELVETECEISSMLEEIDEIMRVQIREKKQTLVINHEGIKQDAVFCDKLRFNQIVLNLLSNATKFTPEGGRIELNAAQLTEAQDGYCVYEIRVKDNGIGMSPEFASKIFNPFERERTSTISGEQGTGLGMAITANIVELMHGHIDVKSEPDKGTEVILSISLRENRSFADNASMDKEETPDFTGKRLLLVEDNELNREIAIATLEIYGFVVEQAVNGEMAVGMVEASEAGYYDAILMDIQMPVMNGYEATKAIRALKDVNIASIPIVAMTANAFEEDKNEARLAGMNGHVAKPIDVDRLIGTLSKVL
ncbi:MAG: response regulator [Lachnospiraceae bacterium]|nr:response regulator [Lachnospiraceae bacterium]